MRSTPEVIALKELLEAKVAELSKTTGLVLSMGYIGNLERGRDDRLWFVWIKGTTLRRSGNAVGVGPYATEDLGRMLDDLNNGALQRTMVHQDGMVWFIDAVDWNGNVQLEAADVADAYRAVVKENA